MPPCPFDILPVELLHTLLGYFSAHEILLTFSNLSAYLDAALYSYPSYRMNCKSIVKSHFDLVCRFIQPEKVISLTLSDASDTPHQSALFLSRFRIEQFAQLRSITLFQLEISSANAIIPHLNKLIHLDSFTFDTNLRIPSCYTDVLFQFSRLKLNNGNQLKATPPLPRLCHLTITKCSIDILKKIAREQLHLRSLNIDLEHNASNIEFILAPLSQLTRLALRVHYSPLSMDQMDQLLVNFPHLKHLELRAKGLDDLADGQRWQRLANRLVTFNFTFNLRLNRIVESLNSFCSAFWLHQKRWFVAYKNDYLFSVPYFAETHVNNHFQPTIYSTTIDDALFYQNITQLTLFSDQIDNLHRFRRVQTMELDCDTSAATLKLIIEQTRAQKLILSLRGNLNTQASLNQYRITDRRNIPRSLPIIQIDQIRTLEILGIVDECIVKQLCCVFPRIERLRVKDVQSKRIMICFIDGFPFLSNASFGIPPYRNVGDDLWHQNPTVAVEETQRKKNCAYTCRFELAVFYLWI